MSDCKFCPVENECGYKYKPCDCIHQRKFIQINGRNCVTKAEYEHRKAKVLQFKLK